jgi:signal transduction histidine kinase
MFTRRLPIRSAFVLALAASAAALAQPREAGEWSEVEGKVSFAGKNGSNVVLELTAGPGRIIAEVADKPGICLPLLLHSRVRIGGIRQGGYAVDGYRSAARLAVPGPEHIHIQEVALKQWSAHPLKSISEARSKGRATSSVAVRLRGVLSLIPGTHRACLEDESGQIIVTLPERPGEIPNGPVEVLGQLDGKGTNAILSKAVWRAADRSQSPNAPALPLLRTTEEVHALRPEEADANYPVRIRGVVTSTDANGGMVQDATRGVYVHRLKSAEAGVGDYVEVEGTTARGTFAPMIDCGRIKRLGRGVLPEPIHPTWERLNNGSMDCQYVEIEGFVTEAYAGSLVLLMPEGHFGVAIVPDAGDKARSPGLPRYVNQHVRIRGTVFATRNNETHRVQAGSIGMGNVTIGHGEPIVTLDKPLAQLLQFDARAAGFHRVKVTGQILHAREREYYISDGTNGLRFVTRQRADVSAGDLVEVVGFPRVAGSAPVLLEAAARQVGRAALPAGRAVAADALSSSANVGMLVQLEARLLGARSNRSDIILELQAGSRSLTARLGHGRGELGPLLAGSQLRLTGVYAGHGRDRVTGAEADSSELLLNSAADIRVLERPSWWTPRRALILSSVLLGVLLLAAGWVVSLRRQVDARTAELKEEIEERKRMQSEVDQVHKKLVDASRKAGMAQIATGVLHNVGNVLNSVNVSANILTENTRSSRIESLTRVASLLEEHSRDLPEFLSRDPRGQRIPRLLRNLEGHFRKEQTHQLQELEDLKKHLEHVKETVAMQQYYAKSSSTVYEPASLIEVVEDALRLQAAAFVRHEITVDREYAPLSPFYLDRHKVLQILVNLLSNAKDACDQKGNGSKRVVVRVKAPEAGQVKVEVEDSGAGIAPQNLQKIFNYGFTTRAKGHGYGLHSSANAAAEMRSSLTAKSEGPGKGATFILTIPWRQSADAISAAA